VSRPCIAEAEQLGKGSVEDEIHAKGVRGQPGESFGSLTQDLAGSRAEGEAELEAMTASAAACCSRYVASRFSLRTSGRQTAPVPLHARRSWPAAGLRWSV
jgi:hypothetical protein